MDKDKLIKKIQALLALSDSPNENEATSAAAKAQELMNTYSLSMAEVSVEDDNDDGVIHQQFGPSKSNVFWKLMLATGIAKANNVKCFSGKDRNNGTRMKYIHFVGRAGLVTGCIALYNYLSETIDRECKRQMTIAKRDPYNEGTSWRSWADSFRKGMADRITERLKEKKEAMETTDSLHEPIGSAIVRQKTSSMLAKENQAFMDGMGLRTQKVGTSSRSADGSNAGRRAGDRAALGGQLKGGAAPARRRVITGR